MERAVHRLKLVLKPLHIHGGVHVLPVKIPVPALLPEVKPGYVGRKHKLITCLVMFIPPEVLYSLPNPRALGVPQDKPSASIVVYAEEVKLLSKLPVVPLLGLFEFIKMGLQFILCRKCRSIDPLKHLALFITAPIGAGNGQELECFCLSGIPEMRAAAEVNEIPLFVYRKGLIRETSYQLQLVILPLSGKETDCIDP